MQLLYPKPQVDLHMMNAGSMLMSQHHQLCPSDMNSHMYSMKQFNNELGYIPPMLSHRLAMPLPTRPRRRRSNHSLVATMDPTTVARRNERERNRVKQVNDGFDALRKRVPFLPDRKKLSKVEILRYAMLYMVDLQCVIEDFDRNNPRHEKQNTNVQAPGRRTTLSENSVSDDQEMYVISDDGGEDSDIRSETSECSAKST